MTAVLDGNSKGEQAQNQAYSNVPCPFCGILCDDLEIERTGDSLKVKNTRCPAAIAGFERRLDTAKPQVAGKDVDLATAIRAAADILRAAKLPLYGGLGTDVDGMRAIMSIADRSKGVIDHAYSDGMYRNYRVLQTGGWFMSTLTEARNRADLFVIVGTDVNKIHPRFFERVVNPPEAMFLTGKRDVVVIGKGLDSAAAAGPSVGTVTSLDCDHADIPAVMTALRAVLNGSPVQGPVGGIPVADLAALAERIRKASYGLFLWSATSLKFPNADLTVQLISELVKDLNKTGRYACLALGGHDGSATSAAVTAWQSGYPLRVSFASGKPMFDPERFAIPRLLAEKQGDALVWISSFSVDLGPPDTGVPLILIGTPGVRSPKAPAVFIPVGTPGVDTQGRVIRGDSVVTMPMQNLGRAKLSSAADVIAAIEAAL